MLYNLFRLQRLEHLAEKFDRKARNVERWMEGKDTQLQHNEDIEAANLPEILVGALSTEKHIRLFKCPFPLPLTQALDKIHETFESDLAAERSRIRQLETIANELSELKYHNAEAVNTRVQASNGGLDNLKNLSEDRKERIRAATLMQQNLDALRLEFAKKAAVSGQCWNA